MALKIHLAAQEAQVSGVCLATNKESLRRLLNWLLPNDHIFANVKLHGNAKWLPRSAIFLALVWCWSSSKNVTDAFNDAMKWSHKLWGSCPFTSYTGFMGAMAQWQILFIELLGPVLHERMQEVSGEFWTFLKWVPIAFDGSRATVPRTESNEEAFCAPNYGNSQTAEYRRRRRQKLKNPRRSKQAKSAKRQKKRTTQKNKIKASQAARKKKIESGSGDKKKPSAPQAPQIWITMMWHMRLRLPWMWRLGPSNSNEREHVLEMLEKGTFQKNTLFCGDAGFIGYEFWSAILRKGFHFLVRVGANVNLLSQSADFEVQDDGRVLCWPCAVQSAGQSPLELRLVKIVAGKTNVWILTSILDSAELSKAEALQLYKMRWGIEVEFRGLKQTLDNGTLGCRADARALIEMHWSVMAMAVAELFALKEQLNPKQKKGRKSEPPATPNKRSLAHTIRALRSCLADLNEVPNTNQDLETLLRRAVTDNYVRNTSKQARHRKVNPDKKPLGDPKVRSILPDEQTKLDSIRDSHAA